MQPSRSMSVQVDVLMWGRNALPAAHAAARHFGDRIVIPYAPSGHLVDLGPGLSVEAGLCSSSLSSPIQSTTSCLSHWALVNLSAWARCHPTTLCALIARRLDTLGDGQDGRCDEAQMFIAMHLPFPLASGLVSSHLARAQLASFAPVPGSSPGSGVSEWALGLLLSRCMLRHRVAVWAQDNRRQSEASQSGVAWAGQ